MRGDVVVVRDFKGRPVVCRVWDEDRLAVYVVDEEGFRLLRSLGSEANLIPAGFPRRDVFVYEPWVEKESGQTSFDWSKLRPREVSN